MLMRALSWMGEKLKRALRAVDHGVRSGLWSTYERIVLHTELTVDRLERKSAQGGRRGQVYKIVTFIFKLMVLVVSFFWNLYALLGQRVLVEKTRFKMPEFTPEELHVLLEGYTGTELTRRARRKVIDVEVEKKARKEFYETMGLTSISPTQRFTKMDLRELIHGSPLIINGECVDRDVLYIYEEEGIIRANPYARLDTDQSGLEPGEGAKKFIYWGRSSVAERQAIEYQKKLGNLKSSARTEPKVDAQFDEMRVYLLAPLEQPKNMVWPLWAENFSDGSSRVYTKRLGYHHETVEGFRERRNFDMVKEPRLKHLFGRGYYNDRFRKEGTPVHGMDPVSRLRGRRTRDPMKYYNNLHDTLRTMVRDSDYDTLDEDYRFRAMFLLYDQMLLDCTLDSYKKRTALMVRFRYRYMGLRTRIRKKRGKRKQAPSQAAAQARAPVGSGPESQVYEDFSEQSKQTAAMLTEYNENPDGTLAVRGSTHHGQLFFHLDEESGVADDAEPVTTTELASLELEPAFERVPSTTTTGPTADAAYERMSEDWVGKEADAELERLQLENYEEFRIEHMDEETVEILRRMAVENDELVMKYLWDAYVYLISIVTVGTVVGFMMIGVCIGEGFNRDLFKCRFQEVWLHLTRPLPKIAANATLKVGWQHPSIGPKTFQSVARNLAAGYRNDKAMVADRKRSPDWLQSTQLWQLNEIGDYAYFDTNRSAKGGFRIIRFWHDRTMQYRLRYKSRPSKHRKLRATIRIMYYPWRFRVFQRKSRRALIKFIRRPLMPMWSRVRPSIDDFYVYYRTTMLPWLVEVPDKIWDGLWDGANRALTAAGFWESDLGIYLFPKSEAQAKAQEWDSSLWAWLHWAAAFYERNQLEERYHYVKRYDEYMFRSCLRRYNWRVQIPERIISSFIDQDENEFFPPSEEDTVKDLRHSMFVYENDPEWHFYLCEPYHDYIKQVIFPRMIADDQNPGSLYHFRLDPSPYTTDGVEQRIWSGWAVMLVIWAIELFCYYIFVVLDNHKEYKNNRQRMFMFPLWDETEYLWWEFDLYVKADGWFDREDMTVKEPVPPHPFASIYDWWTHLEFHYGHRNPPKPKPKSKANKAKTTGKGGEGFGQRVRAWFKGLREQLQGVLPKKKKK